MLPALFAVAATAVVPLDTVTIAALFSLLVPLAVSFITKREASDGLKAVTNIVATAVVAAVVIVLTPPDGVAISWQLVVNTFVASLLTSYMAYRGIWKPTGVTASIAQKSATFGLGSPPVLETSAGAVENGDASAYATQGSVDWSSIPSADGEPQRLDREPDMVPGDNHTAELKSLEQELTARGESADGQAFRDSQGK